MQKKAINFFNKAFLGKIVVCGFLLLLSVKALSQPTITSFSPTSGPAGTVVTITGTNFSPVADSNIVFFGAVRAVVLAATGTTLTALAPSANTYQPITITVNNLTVYSTEVFLITFTTSCPINAASFEPKQDFISGNYPFSVSTGDFDGDGKIDVVAANYSDKTFSLFKNNTSAHGIISFLPKVTYVTEPNPGSIFTGDIDGDGKLDIVVACDLSKTVSVYRNTSMNGIISFDNRVNFATGTYAVFVSIGDLNSDGKPDIIVTNNQENTVSFFKNTGNVGSISFAPRVNLATGNSPSGIVIKDLNNDHKPEIIVANQYSNSLSIFKNIGNGNNISFETKVDFITNSQPYQISSGDIDGDGKAELITGSLTSNTISILKNTSNSGIILFSEKSDFFIGISPGLAAIGDLNGDGKPDLAISSSEVSLAILINVSTNDNINFAQKINLGLNGSSSFASIADLNNDGRPDIIGASLNLLSIFKNIGNSIPGVFISNPLNGNSFYAGTDINLNAFAFDYSGLITKVEFYNNGNKFAEDSIYPYDYFAQKVESGNYTLTAKAFDNCGDSTVSTPINITVIGCTGSGNITGEGYTNITGTQVADLLNNLNYPNSPSVTAPLNSFEYATVGDSYGARLRGYICAPQTGAYTFYIAGDDQAGLWLSTDENPANKVLIAYNETPVGFRAWTTFATQKSAPITLIKGVRYYIETLHKQNTGTNHLSVGWVLPDGTAEGPIPGNRLSPIGSSFPNIGNGTQNFGEAMQQAMNNAALKVTVAPNPSSTYFTLIIQSNNNKELSIMVTDASGRVVETKSNLAANRTVQIGDKLTAGVYFVEVMQDGKKQRMKLVKQ
jgi:PA14 domain/FG-GAP-like repeat/Bacterial Ig domain/Secretion system C-terminal sorting domain/IPT/TIG domain